ncbi:hypothetical protein LTR84_006825 [Exophiala bonariae]|uniref:Uncharacterized protein n=1 Tax=Exophiala bonariae TaxID=1690606 RepID=A0AAV9N008_9EURO|nr:hypothetical protein LTR84_006825 [Exophiala bonariae]
MGHDNLPIYPDLCGKVALITGIGQVGPIETSDLWGNGAAIALILARNGVKIFGCDINIKAGIQTKSRIQSELSDAVVDVVATDVTSSSAVESLVQACLQLHGRIDILINNVGRNEPGGPAEMSEETWDDQIDVNLKSVYLTCHFVLPIMEAQGTGSVVNLSSIAAERYLGKAEVAYSAAKAAVTQFTNHTALLYAKKGIRLNTVLPGLMFTPLVYAIAHKFSNGDAQSFVDTRNGQVPTGKMGSSLDVANAVAFLSSTAAAGFITGQQLVVDGGMISSTGRA